MSLDDAHKAIEKAIVETIQDWVKEVYTLSQDTNACYVPVDTGVLKASGSVVNTPTGSSLQYSANYAAIVHDGDTGGQPYSGDQRVWVSAHKRKDGVVVPGQYKIYTNKRLVRIRPKTSKFSRGAPIYRVLEKTPKIKGQFFVQRAFVVKAGDFVKILTAKLQKVEQRTY